MNVAIIVAGGSGQRLGAACAKQFLELCGAPVLVHTLRAFEYCEAVDQVILVLPKQECEAFTASLPKYGVKKVTQVVRGGPERQDSVLNGLRRINPSEAEIVAVHDGVRPLITPEEITRVVEQARHSGAATIGYPVTDTLKEVDGTNVIRTLDRRRFYVVQTPQAFRAEILLRAYEHAGHEGTRATDDAALVEQDGVAVSVVEGSRENLKITWADDLDLAEYFMKRRKP